MYQHELTADEKSRLTGDEVVFSLRCPNCGCVYDADFEEMEGAEMLWDCTCPGCGDVTNYALDADGDVIWPPLEDGAAEHPDMEVPAIAHRAWLVEVELDREYREAVQKTP